MAVVCLHTTESLCFLKKIIENDTTFRLFSLPLHADTHSAHAELMLFFLFKGEMVETRTWEGRGIIHNIKVRLLCA